MAGFIEIIENFLNLEFFDNKIWQFIVAILLFFGLYFLLKFVVKRVHEFAKKYTKGQKEENFLIVTLNIIKKMPLRLFLAIEFYIPLKVLTFQKDVNFVINVVFLFIVTVWFISATSKLLIFGLSKVFKNKNDKRDKTVKKTIEMIVKILVWIIGILIFLTNIGINLTPLVASLGVASVAVAFALQNILKDLFSSFSIIMSKPFNVGDYIVVGEGSKERVGTVKNITLKATYLSSISGHEIIVPNSKILDTEVINYGNMKNRRKRFTIGVTYETGIKKLEEIPKIIEKAVKGIKDIEYEWCYLTELNYHSIDFYISYNILNPDYTYSLSVHEKVIFKILEDFVKKSIDIAYPTQTVHLVQKK